MVAFLAVMFFPHPKCRNLFRAHRLVVLPDYQGIGLGVRFLESVAKFYAEEGNRFSIITSARNLVCALARSDNWILRRYDIVKYGNSVAKISAQTVGILKKQRTNVRTASFYYRPGERNR